MFSQSAYIWEGLDPSKLTVIAPSIDAFSPKNHLMGFTTVTAVLRAAALAGDHNQHPRAVFERLDGSVGLVCNQAQMVEEQQLRLDVPVLAQISRWDRLKDPLGVLAAFAEHVTLAEESPPRVGRPRRDRRGRRPRGRRGLRRSRSRLVGASPAASPARASGAAADGRSR